MVIVMKLSISNIAWEAKNDEIVYSYMKECGFSGVEIAPTRWVQENPYGQVEKAVKIAENLKETYGFTVPSMQSIWFGRQENLFSSEEERNTLIDYTKKAIDYAAAIDCKNLVFGCPRNRNVSDSFSLSQEQAEEIAAAFFHELGEYAYEKGTVIGMEANPPIYNTNFANTTKEALALVEKAASKGFLLNLDVGTMVHNGEDIGILKDKVSLINHVHISEPGLKLIEQRELHRELAELLQEENYNNFVSIEVGKQEDVTVLKTVMEYIAEVYHD